MCYMKCTKNKAVNKNTSMHTQINVFKWKFKYSYLSSPYNTSVYFYLFVLQHTELHVDNLLMYSSNIVNGNEGMLKVHWQPVSVAWVKDKLYIRVSYLQLYSDYLVKFRRLLKKFYVFGYSPCDARCMEFSYVGHSIDCSYTVKSRNFWKLFLRAWRPLCGSYCCSYCWRLCSTYKVTR